MTRKSAFLIIILAVVAALGGLAFWYFYLSPVSPLNVGGAPSGSNNLFPFGNSGGESNKPEESSTTSSTIKEGGVAPDVREVTDTPVSGFVLVSDKQLGETVRYMERETGHTYRAPLNSVTKARISNTTIPKVSEALWIPGGERVIARYLNDRGDSIETFSARVMLKEGEMPDQNSEGELLGVFLKNNIPHLSVSPLGDKIFYLYEEGNLTNGYVSDLEGKKPIKTFSSPLREWLADWVTDNTIVLNTKPSAKALGYVFSLNSKTGDLKKILGNRLGLVSLLNQKGNFLLFSESTGDGLKLSVLDLKTQKVVELPIITLADKCAWSPADSDLIYCGAPKNIESGDYPDLWYKGLVNFNDDIWKINVKTGESKVISNIGESARGSIDVYLPKMTKDGRYLVFMNKMDLSLWSVRLPEGF